MALRLILAALLAPSILGFCPSKTATAITTSTRLLSEVSTTGGLDRRDVLAASFGAVSVVAGLKTLQSSSLLVPSTLVDENRQVLTSVEDALALIDSQIDRRFFHALVASDYQLLYRGVGSTRDARYPSVVKVESLSQETPVAEDFLAAVGSSSLVEDFSGNTPFHLTTTYSTKFRSMSIWPLGENVHFAWTEREEDMLLSSNNNKLIVDGVDCGVMSLEDALERPKGQVMVHADSFLLVPASMEQELISKLKDSFLV